MTRHRRIGGNVSCIWITAGSARWRHHDRLAAPSKLRFGCRAEPPAWSTGATLLTALAMAWPSACERAVSGAPATQPAGGRPACATGNQRVPSTPRCRLRKRRRSQHDSSRPTSSAPIWYPRMRRLRAQRRAGLADIAAGLTLNPLPDAWVGARPVDLTRRTGTGRGGTVELPGGGNPPRQPVGRPLQAALAIGRTGVWLLAGLLRSRWSPSRATHSRQVLTRRDEISSAG